MTYDGPLLQTWVPRMQAAVPDGIAAMGERLMGEFDLDLDSRYNLIKPDIEGTYAFDKIWQSNNALLSLILDRNKAYIEAKRFGTTEPPPADILGTDVRSAFYTLHAMQKAHVITVDPLQIDAIPNFEEWDEAFDFGNHVKLPFNCIFLDCELPTRISSESTSGNPFELIGALCAIEDETLIIVPFGRAQKNEKNYEQTIDMGGDGEGEHVIRKVHDWDPHYSPLGAVVINLADPDVPRDDESFTNQKPFSSVDGSSLGMSYTIWRTTVTWFGEQLHINRGLQNDDASQRLDYDWKPKPGSALDRANIVIYPHNPEEIHVGSALATASMNMIATGMVLKILYFLDTPNIEIGQAELSRQVRRAAERRGARITQTVWVKHNSKRYTVPEGHKSNEAGYTHQFEVRGHWKCFPEGTRTADARPDLLRYVPGRGMCRKIWCPPFVKGPEDAPLVIKTRRVRED